MTEGAVIPLNSHPEVSSLTSKQEDTATQPASDATLAENANDDVLLFPKFSVILPKCELPPPKEYEPVESFVSKAVKEQDEQSDDSPMNKGYKAITDAFRAKKDLPLLRKILLALRTSQNTVHSLTSTSRKHARLVHQIVRFDPFLHYKDDEMGYSLADAHLHLVVVLVSANSTLLVPALNALWKLLTSVVNSREECWGRIHATIATIARICPTAQTELFPIFYSNAPFKAAQTRSIRWYYHQCLRALEYVPSLEGEVIRLLVQKCIELDVEIKINNGGEVSIEQDEEQAEGIFQLDMDEGVPQTPKTKNYDLPVDKMANRLDAIMLLLFAYVEKRLQEDPSSVPVLFRILMNSFESCILITYKSKFVQFLLLHLCGLDSRQTADDDDDDDVLYREFATKLIDVIVDPYRAIATRQCGACYLASFISRAAFVCPETVCEAVSALLRWAEAYAAESLKRQTVYAADMRQQCNLHALFYTVCQAAFYIMCFRGVEAIEFQRKALSSTEEPYDEPSRIDISPERWTRLCKHLLQPLRYCLESVRSEFLIVAKSYHLISEEVLDQLLSDEKRMASNAGKKRKQTRSKISTPATLEKERFRGGVGGMGPGENPLESFFPFDPYLLERSSKFVEPFYGHWSEQVPVSVSEGEDDVDMNDEDMDQNSSGAISEDESDSEDDSDEDVERDDDGSHAMSYESGASIESDASNMRSRDQEQFSVEDKTKSLHNAWAVTLQRARAPSMENGSW